MKPFKLSATLVALFVCVGIVCVETAIADDTSDQKKIDFNADVRPILNQHCVACHGGVKQASDLSFVYEDQALSVIEAGDPEESEFFARIISDDEDERMPPPEHGRGLNEEETKTIQNWISQGAKWGKHWAFSAPKKSDAPTVENTKWAKSPIDPFILAKLETAKIEPAPMAPPERWLRRASLDLIGLPPSPDQTKKFLANLEKNGDAAFAVEVDRLLQSESFGERWASVWLDAVRYADSRGLGLDARRTIWKYRDWVIRAMNDDMPYDQFTIRQLAGDLMPKPSMDDLVATASQRLTQTCEEGGTDDEMFRVEAVVDRVNTNWQVWQGLSFGCVQCHSHPYDPIRHEEYYQFMAFFNNSVDCDLGNEAPNAAVPLDDTQAARAIKLDRKINKAVTALWESGFEIASDDSKWKSLVEPTVKTNNLTKAIIVGNDWTEFETKGTVSKNTSFVITAKLPKNLKQLTAIQFTGMPEDLEKAKKDSEWGFVVSHFSAELTSVDDSKQSIELAYVIGDEPQPLMDPQASLNPKNGSGFAAYTRIHFPRSAAFVLKEPQSVKPGDTITITIKQNSMALGAFPLVSHRGRVAVSSDPSLTKWLNNKKHQTIREQIAKLKKDRSSIAKVNIPVMVERPSHIARPTHIFDRGNFLTKTKPVSANVPRFLPKLPDSKQDSYNRMDLAKWIATTENPLTARVAVNRIWGELFGIGLVETQEDFGSAGSVPSHPLLLDDLAARFQTEMKWSTKTLMRELVLSSTYRQSSKTTKQKLDVDPRNRLLSRGPRNRLPAETIRDQSLLISGLLSPKQFGPPVHPPIPSGIWKPFQGGDKWNTPKTDNPERYRRSVYTYTKRTIPYPVLASFDAPSREFCAVRRLPSNTPLQALMAMNDATFVEATQALARRMNEAKGSLDEKLDFGFQLAVCRTPTEKESGVLRRLYEKSQTKPDEVVESEDEKIEDIKTKDSKTESTEAQNTNELAAFANVASVLLNLDEVLTK
ncbi:MAG: PSD1 and planctomycete cytochrome C domain-containing protein [Mariniblastus sp.]